MSIIQANFELQYDEYDLFKLKKDYFNSLFKREGNSYVCTNVYLLNFYKKLYNKYFKNIAYEDFFSECMSYTYEAILKFNILDKGNWINIINNTDKLNVGRLMTYIKKTVDYKIYEEVINEDKLFTRANIDGIKGQHVMVMLDIISLDTTITGENGEEVKLENIVENEHNFLGSKYYCYWNYFLDWFNRNKARILTKNQLSYLDKALSCSKKNKRIRERVLRAWERENPLQKKTVYEIIREHELEVWKGLYQIVYDDDIDVADTGQRLSEWIVANLDRGFVANLIYDNLDGNETRFVVSAYHGRGVIPNHVLYKIINAVEVQMDELKISQTWSNTFYKRENEKNGWNLERHKRYSEYLHQFVTQPCFVYDKNGELIQMIEVEKSKELNILKITPTGIEVLTKLE